MPRTLIHELLFIACIAVVPFPAFGEQQAGQETGTDASSPEVETGSQPEAQSDDARIGEEPDAGDPAAGGGSDPGPFAFFDPEGGMDIAEGACGPEAEAWINTAMMDLDGAWTMELGPSVTGGGRGEPQPLAGAGADTVMIAERDGDVFIGGAAFAAEVPLRVWQGSGLLPGTEPGETDVRSDGATAALGCAFDRLARLTARGTLSEENGGAPFLLALAAPNARALLGVLRTGEGEAARRRLVRLMR